jgi:ribosome biogenesis GTPase A
LLNKSDLVIQEEIKDWIKLIEQKTSCPVLTTDTKTNRNFQIIEKKVLELSEPRIQALIAKGLLRRPARVVVVGLPNVGKSSIINKLTKSSKTKTGAKAGITRQQQWVRINPNIDLLDTPGIIPMKQENQERAKKLAFVNSVSENAYSSEIVAKELICVISENPKYITKFKDYYNISEHDDLTLENISKSRNWVITGGEADIERTSQYVLRDFRDGKIGKFILDNISELS